MADGLLQRQVVVGVGPSGVRQGLLPGQPLPAAQLPVAGVDEDAGQPGVKEFGLAQLFQPPQGLIHRLVHRLQGVGLTAQVQVRGAVQPLPQGFHPGGEFLLIQRALPPFVFL